MEWLLNRYFWVINLLLIGLFGLGLAGVSTRIIKDRFEVKPDQFQPPIRRSTGTIEETRRHRSNYAVILDKNIFHAVVKEAPSQKKSQTDKPVPAEQAKDLAKTPLNVTLRGTAVRDGGGSFAVIEDKRARKEDLYRTGDMILGEAKLIQILEDRVVILREGKKEVLELFAQKETGRTSQKAVASAQPSRVISGRGIRRLGARRWSVSQEEIESAKANMSQLMTQIRITPNFVEGKPDGFKLLSIRRGSLFDRLGLRSGDVVKRINGVLLDNPQKALEIYGELDSGQTVTVDVLRRGQEQSFTYELK
jgi:general secretion pathway protein C